ncbi:hypothetical protein [[Flexibacter] sp. ATCC 35208]|uniref:hypothetical protein n=1 Tax=[Flexibacter] sp. ATCC 35208 TaxID=1936242 RepID=UPI0009D44117|nr:hypothetical protein [[Flexibacter] sp. ATCC 35208]OMP75195.1 hypothetical protein BW716_31580 [[Flexibacter] sp. ATCC 35208]
MRGNLFSLAFLVSNAGAILILLISIWYKRAGRIIIALLFLIAALVNAWQATFKPDVYNVYELIAALPVYEYLIAEVLLIHITLYIILLMIIQLFIGIGILYNRKTALVAGIVYLLALAPLGAGSSFPCTVILAIAVILLLKREKQI